jgi:glucose dehydrogenase
MEDRRRHGVWGWISYDPELDLIYYGTMDRWFKAVHARTGELLWQFEVESGIIGQPVTYPGPDGKQYVAILAGVGGWAGATAMRATPRPHSARQT